MPEISAGRHALKEKAHGKQNEVIEENRTVLQREPARAKIKADTEAFLLAGGVIVELAPGVTMQDPTQHKEPDYEPEQYIHDY